MEALGALALGSEDRCWKPRNSHPFHTEELLVKCESWKFRVPEHVLTKEIVLLAEILAGLFLLAIQGTGLNCPRQQVTGDMSPVKTHKIGYS